MFVELVIYEGLLTSEKGAIHVRPIHEGKVRMERPAHPVS